MDNPNDFNGSQIVIVSVIFLVITYISVSLRCFTRVFITDVFSADDWLMIVAQGNFTLSCALILRAIHYGLGHHNAALPIEERIQALKYQALATATYVTNMMFIKISIAIFLLRIAVKRRYTWILRISIVIITIWSIALFLYSIFQCSPVQAQWDTTISPATCVSGGSFVAAAYSQSVMSIISDWMYALLPIFMIWSVQMTLQKKITVGFILGLGIFASIATLIRLKYLLELADYSDILYNGTTAMVWTLIEPGIAITAASLITIRPLLRALNLKGFDSTNPSRSRPTANHQSISLRNDIPADSWNASSTFTGPVKPAESKKTETVAESPVQARPRSGPERADSDTGSEEYILQGATGITRTVDVTISHDKRSTRDGTGR